MVDDPGGGRGRTSRRRRSCAAEPGTRRDACAVDEWENLRTTLEGSAKGEVWMVVESNCDESAIEVDNVVVMARAPPALCHSGRW